MKRPLQRSPCNFRILLYSFAATRAFDNWYRSIIGGVRYPIWAKGRRKIRGAEFLEDLRYKIFCRSGQAAPAFDHQ